MIPWWAKIGAKLVLSRLPFGYAVWQRLGLFRHGEMDRHDYAFGVFNQHVSDTGLESCLTGRVVLELGPGDSISTAIFAATYGARAILVDSGNFVRSDVAVYQGMERALAARGLTPPSLKGCADVDAVLECCEARYLTAGLQSLRELPSSSVDLIFSHAVLEHIRRRDFMETLRECRRILRPGGVSSHQVDLRDHLGGALNNLRFSERIWESEFFARSGFYTNRICFAQMLSMFSAAGFTAEVGRVQRWPKLPTPRRSLAPQFREVSDQDLLVSSFDVRLR